MKRLFRHLSAITALVLLSAIAVKAQYVPVEEGSSVKFTIKNLGFNSDGSFTGLEGKIDFDPANPGKALFDVSIKATSINTDNNMRDNHLRKDSYFDVEHYPKISFVSSSVKASKKEGEYVMEGKLTIKKTTKDISFPFTAERKGEGFLFNGSFRINRKDFEVGGSSTLSNELTVTLSVLAKKG